MLVGTFFVLGEEHTEDYQLSHIITKMMESSIENQDWIEIIFAISWLLIIKIKKVTSVGAEELYLWRK